MEMTTPRRLIPRSQTADRYGVCTKTIENWRKDPKVNFPPGVRILNRWYDDIDRLEAFDQKKIGPAE
jgi:hypothetical protein